MLAHQGSPDETVTLMLLFSSLWIAWAGWSRLKGKGFPRLPAWTGPGLIVLAGGFAVAGAVVPRALFPTPAPVASGPRPSSTATLSFAEPLDRRIVEGDEVEVVLDLQGGRIVEDSSIDLTPDTGHVHLVLDRKLVSMTYGLVQIVSLDDVAPGSHTLQAENVAADHAPFDPRVTATVRFETEGP
jgi:hypothetical protein